MPRKKVTPLSVEVKKPSLAALKGTDKKSAAAKRKAVQKIDTAMAAKSPSKKLPKRKRTVTIAEVAVTTSPKKTNKRRVAATEKTPSVKSSFFTGTSSITLPTNMSIRAKEKALVLLEQVSKDFAGSAQQISYIAGICFILLGATVSVAFSGSLGSAQKQTAAVLESSSSSTTTDTSPGTISIPSAHITLLDPLPVEVTGTTEHKLSAVHTKSVSLRIRSLETGKTVAIPVAFVSNGLYSFSINHDHLDPGTNEVTAFSESSLQAKVFEFRLGTILVPTIPSTTTPIITNPIATSTSQEPSTDIPGVRVPPLNVPLTSTPTASSTRATTSTVETSQIEASEGAALRLRLPNGDLSGETVFKIDASPEVTFIELFTRPTRTSEPRYVGRAVKRSNEWYYFLDTKHLPNGEYVFYARTRVSNKEVISENVRRDISNQIPTPLVTEKLDSPEDTKPAPSPVPTVATVSTESTEDNSAERPTEAVITSGRSLPNVTIDDTARRDLQNTGSIKDPTLVREVLLQYDEDIRELFNRYSIARQTGDELLLRLAEEEIEAGKKAVLDNILLDSSVAIYVLDLATALDERFLALKKQVDTFEELRRTASNNATAVDTDGDGISDFDEVNLYQTDPAMADTDGDGILDGVEIMRGFDPRNASAEAVITFESPRDVVTLVQEDVLTVADVVPIVTEEETERLVLAEIRGTDLPNSFVTLYIFSTPTIVTVRTDDTGAFVYRFEKELEDGEHEVYAAITDNTGAIVARSNPFRFVKEAEAFTVAGAQDAMLVSEMVQDDSSLTNPYNVAGGMGILALGLILLMLGITMREQQSLKDASAAHGIAIS